jgi:hypothetical protein
MRRAISVGDIVKMKGSKKVKSAPVGIIVETFIKDPQFTSAECIVLWFCSGVRKRMYTKELSRITLDHL